jgi:hypothetical protein
VFLNLANLPTRAGGFGPVDWTDWLLDSSIMPADISAVILEAIASMNSPDGPIEENTAYLKVRRRQSDPDLVLLRGASAERGDSISWGGQGFSPVHEGKFQYAVTPPGFNFGWRLRIIGYFP